MSAKISCPETTFRALPGLVITLWVNIFTASHLTYFYILLFIIISDAFKPNFRNALDERNVLNKSCL